nr:hypothetical protein [Tanacetum cinerariifolium]
MKMEILLEPTSNKLMVVLPLLVTAPTLPPSSIPIISQVQHAPAPLPATAPSTSLQDLPNFSSLFGFDHRKEPKSTSAPKEKASKTSGKSTEWSKSHQKTTSESTPAKEPMQTTQDLEEPSHQEFETRAADDQPVAEASQHPEWFQKHTKPPTPDRAWNKTWPATYESI